MNFKVTVNEGEKYFWCACGVTSKPPFCDGSHKGSGIKSLPFVAQKSGEVLLCGCKNTKNPPYCDGSHSNY